MYWCCAKGIETCQDLRASSLHVCQWKSHSQKDLQVDVVYHQLNIHRKTILTYIVEVVVERCYAVGKMLGLWHDNASLHSATAVSQASHVTYSSSERMQGLS